MIRLSMVLGLLVLLAPPALAAGPPPDDVRLGPGKQPQLAIDAKGRVYVAFGDGRAIKVARSADGGHTFAAPVTVAEPKMLALGMRRGPRIAAAGETLVVAAAAGEIGMGRDGDILAWRSTDLGRSWTGPTRINAVPGSAREGLHALAGTPDGHLLCVWLDLRNSRTEIIGASSRDAGATWEPDRLIYRNPERSVCECCHPSIAFDRRGSAAVLWRNSLSGNRDMYLRVSTDDMKTFEPPRKLGRLSWSLNACPMDGGSVALLPSGQAVTVWQRAGSVIETRPDGTETNLGPGVQPWCAAGPNGPIVVWLKSRPGRLMFKDRDARPTVLAERAADPVVASYPGGDAPVIAAWEDPDDGSVVVRQVVPPPPP